jgi:hypothetical protein
VPYVEVVHKMHKFSLRVGVLIGNVGESGKAALYARGDSTRCGHQFLEEGEHDISCGSPQPRADR